jgi:hypothetical protein
MGVKTMPYHTLTRERFVQGQKKSVQECAVIEITSDQIYACFAACFSENIKELSERLEQNNINLSDDTGKTLLMFAARHSNSKMLKFLLSQPGINVLIEDKEGRTALDCVLKRDLTTNTDFEMARDLIRKGADIDKVNKSNQTHLLDAWIAGDEEGAKRLIKLGAKIAFSEDLFKKNTAEYSKFYLRYSSHNSRCYAQVKEHGQLSRTMTDTISDQIELSKQFVKEEQAKEQAKWLGVAASYICFYGKIEKSLLEVFLLDIPKKESVVSKLLKIKSEKKHDSEIDTTVEKVMNIMSVLKEADNDPMRKAFHLGFGMMKNRLKQGQYAPVRFFESIPPTLLFRGQVEHRERALANEICWQQWKNDYYYSKYPERKDQSGYGPGAMIVAKP